MTMVQCFSQVIYDHDANYLTSADSEPAEVYALCMTFTHGPERFLVPLIAAALIASPRPGLAINCAGTSTGSTPLTDLATGTYQGFQGGLYTGGVNGRPAAHRTAGLQIASQIVPLDTLGNPSASGRVVVISIGMSNCTQEFSALVPKMIADPLRRPQVKPIDCAEGGQAARDIHHASAAYWDTVYARLRGHGSSPLQPQVVWLKEAERAPTGQFPASAESLEWDLGAIVRVIHQKLPNVRACYVSSRIYAGYATSNLNPEPYAYESGFAVKWLIEAQSGGVDSLNWDPALGAVQAPWLTWGPYLWADGLQPRGDGLTWRCDEYQSDGTHPNDVGRNVVADTLLAFFQRDETTVPWYRAGTVSVVDDTPSPELRVGPVPARRRVFMSLSLPSKGVFANVTRSIGPTRPCSARTCSPDPGRCARISTSKGLSVE